MNYRMVRQFSNNAIDNIFNFFYKIVDFGKIWIDVFWAFVEVWEAFFLIFYNFFMYFYYLLLLGVDKSTESKATFVFWRRLPQRSAYVPPTILSRDVSNPVPGLYGRESVAKTISAAASAGAAAKSTVADTVKSASDLMRRTPDAAGKKPFFRTISASLVDFMTDAWTAIKKPFMKIADYFASRMRPVREEVPAQGSLIDEYMKEYERKRKRK